MAEALKQLFSMIRRGRIEDGLSRSCSTSISQTEKYIRAGMPPDERGAWLSSALEESSR